MAASAPPSGGPSMNYHLLASLISLEPDFAIFRRFLKSNARDLLRLQAEITHLESNLESLIAADRVSGNRQKAESEFYIASLKGEKGLQWEMQVELGDKLRLFRTALLQYKQLCELPSVNKSDLTNLREVLDTDGGDHGFPRRRENTIWSERNEQDLTSLMGRYEKLDPFSKWIESKLLRWYDNKIGHRLRDPISLAESVQVHITHYGDSKQTAIVNAISTILSSLLPVIAIFALYFIQHPLARMGAIVAFTLLFSIGLTVIANSRRVDCFAAVAAFAAVQVVFVGNNLGNKQVS